VDRVIEQTTLFDNIKEIVKLGPIVGLRGSYVSWSVRIAFEYANMRKSAHLYNHDILRLEVINDQDYIMPPFYQLGPKQVKRTLFKYSDIPIFELLNCNCLQMLLSQQVNSLTSFI
jgi:hypothetical protein